MSLVYRAVILLVLLSFGLISTVQAQTEAETLETLAIDLWPDYDRTAVLVLMTGVLPEDVPLPISVSMPLPTDADLNVVARITDDFQMIDDVDYQVQANQLVLTAPERRFRVEYYMPYVADGDARTFDFSWLAGLNVDQFEIAIQQPTAASELSTDPITTNVGEDSNDGLTYHIMPAQAVPAGTPYDVGVTYTMSSPTLTASQPVPAPPASAPEITQPTAVDSTIDWPLILAGVGVGLILAAIVWQIASSRQNKKKRPRKKTPTRPSAPKVKPTKAAKFCHECGVALQANDKFCRECGTAVKQR